MKVMGNNCGTFWGNPEGGPPCSPLNKIKRTVTNLALAPQAAAHKQ